MSDYSLQQAKIDIAKLQSQINTYNRIIKVFPNLLDVRGYLKLANTPTADLHAATKKYVDDNNAVPACSVYNSSGIAIANNSGTYLTFNSEDYDTDGIHSTVSNTGRLTCQTAGIYHIWGVVEFAANTTGIRSLFIRLNGGNLVVANSTNAPSVGANSLPVSRDIELDEDDYIELGVYQNSGGALNVQRTADYSPYFGMTYLRPAP